MNIICEDGSWRDSAANLGDPIQDCKGEHNPRRMYKELLIQTPFVFTQLLPNQI